MSIFQALYEKKRRREDPEYAQKLRDRDRLRQQKKREERGVPKRIPVTNSETRQILMVVPK